MAYFIAEENAEVRNLIERNERLTARLEELLASNRQFESYEIKLKPSNTPEDTKTDSAASSG